LGKICFVPASIPVGVEVGGHVLYKPDVVRFEQTLAGHRGALGFTVMPTLTEDITPPQVLACSFYTVLNEMMTHCAVFCFISWYHHCTVD
jgi:hypothetical protein